MLPYLLLLTLLSNQISAFPSVLSKAYFNEQNYELTRNGIPCPHMEKLAKRQALNTTPPFDAAQQYVSNTGAHAFVPPGATDQRGPCPGLNAMANHGYLPHNGVGNFTDFITGSQAAFGMGTDLASFLAVYGAVFDGDLTSYSIGGPVAGPVLSGLLGTPEGLSGSHNKYEGDVSPTRGDLYQYGNDYKLQVSQFTALYNLGQQNGDCIDLGVLTNYRVSRFQQSVSENPYFFNGPFSGVVASPAAWSFVYRLMGNKSSEYPEGLLTGDVLKSFYSITGESGNFVYTPGHEAFPDNWYKRNPLDDYTTAHLSLDTLAMALRHPQFTTIGGNTGKVNSFTGIDPANLTGGVYTDSNILQGHNITCYGLEVSLMEAPDILAGLYSDVDAATVALGYLFGNATSDLGCPQLNAVNKDQFKSQLAQYPGYAKLKADGTY